jgi:hypothetical protein
MKTQAHRQQARRASAERLYGIAISILKEAGVETWEFHEKGLCGRAYTKRSHVVCPKPTTRRRLYVLAHECAHIVRNHTTSKPSHRKEYEAELYAHEVLRRHGIAVPKKETEIAKKYVARRIDQAIRIGKAKQLDSEAVKWCETEHQPATILALKRGSIMLVDLSGEKRARSTSARKRKDQRPNA